MPESVLDRRQDQGLMSGRRREKEEGLG